MKAIAIALGFLTVALPGLAQAQGMFSIPAEYEALNRPRPELVLLNPFFTHEGERIRGVKFSVDGSWHEAACSQADRNGDGKSCGRGMGIDPGPHILAVVICTRPDCSGFGKAWNAELRFNVGLRERVSVDLSKVPQARTDEEAITRESLQAKAKSPCANAIEHAFYVNTCTASGVKEFKAQLARMGDVCERTWSKDTDLLFELAFWQAAYVDAGRCYKASELKKVPDFLVGWQVDEGFWPQGSIRDGASSWRWAREGDEERLFAKYEGKELREKAFERVRQWYERQVVVDQLIDAVLDPAHGVAPVIAAARSAPWDMNPSSPTGHRNFVLSTLASSDSRFKNAPGLQEVLARGAVDDPKIDCDEEPEVSRLIRSYTADGTLSADEWRSVSSFLKRTQPDASLSRCSAAFDEKLKGPISQEERLEFLAKTDCAPARSEKHRGTTLSNLLDPDHHAAPKPLRLKLMQKYADCVAF